MIAGVKTKTLRVIPDERGRLMEILRRDDAIFQEFGQVYLSTTYPGVVKAWHMHKSQSDNICCVQGMIKLVLYDGRPESPTFSEINEFFMGPHNPLLVQVPTHVLHGWKCVSPEEALVVNVPTNVYNRKQPDEHRLDPHQGGVPYDWTRKDG